MKKRQGYLLLLCLLVGLAMPALATQGVEVTQSNLELVNKSAATYVTVNVEMQNKTEHAQEIDGFLISITNLNGEEVYAASSREVYPKVVAPGQKAFAIYQDKFIGAMPEQFSTVTVTPVYRETKEAVASSLQEQLRLTRSEDDETWTLTLENISDAKVEEIMVIVSFYGEGKQFSHMIGIDYDRREGDSITFLPEQSRTFTIRKPYEDESMVQENPPTLEEQIGVELIAMMDYQKQNEKPLTMPEAFKTAENAGAGVTVTEQNTYKHGYAALTSLYTPFELTNTGDKTVYVKGCNIDVLDAEGTVLEQYQNRNVFPRVLAPGGKAYGVIERDVYCAGETSIGEPQITPITVATDEKAFSLPLTLEYHEIDDCCGVIRTVFGCKNDTQRDLISGTLVGVYRDSKGKLVDVVIQPYLDAFFDEEPIQLSVGEERTEEVLRMWHLNYATFTQVIEGEDFENFTGFVCEVQ